MNSSTTQSSGRSNLVFQFAHAQIYCMNISVNGENCPAVVPPMMKINFIDRNWAIRIALPGDTILQILIDFDNITTFQVESVSSVEMPMQLITFTSSSCQVFEGRIPSSNSTISNNLHFPTVTSRKQKLINPNPNAPKSSKMLNKNGNPLSKPSGQFVRRNQQRFSIVVIESSFRKSLQALESTLYAFNKGPTNVHEPIRKKQKVMEEKDALGIVSSPFQAANDLTSQGNDLLLIFIFLLVSDFADFFS